MRELLESAELHKMGQLPWWDTPSDDGQSSLSLRIPHGAKPNLMAIPTHLVDQASRGVSLLYNICAVLYVSLDAGAHTSTDMDNWVSVSLILTSLTI